METDGGGLEGAVEGPEGQIGELGGSEQVDVDVAQTQAHQAVRFDEVQDLFVDTIQGMPYELGVPAG